MRTARIKVKPADIRRLVEGKSLTINLPADVTTLEIVMYTVEDGKKDARTAFVEKMSQAVANAGDVVTTRTEEFLGMVADGLFNKL